MLLCLDACLLAAGAGFDAAQWRLRTWDNGAPRTSALNISARQGGCIVPLSFPGRTEIVCDNARPLQEVTHVVFSFHCEAPLPESFIATVFAKDKDNLWRQIRDKCPRPDSQGNFSLCVPFAGPEAVASWEPCGHGRPWTSLTPRLLAEYGCIFEEEPGHGETFTSEIVLTGVEPLRQAIAKYPTPARDVSCTPGDIPLGEIFEATFRLACWPSAPFDSSRTKIRAQVTLPSGEVENAMGFYYEDFIYDREEWDKTKCLEPWGEPCFKVRYCPRVPGPHSMSISCDIDDELFALPPMRFEARANPSFHGFIRLDKDHNQFFAYDDGSFFWGLGMNVRSPYDNRYKQVAPYSTWEDMGLAAYERLMEKYEKAGINVMEVWMSSWWLALEWKDDAPGFHGVGHYNQYRAWMLDHIFRLARKHGINIILVINNHGKFAMNFDTEWKRNPYNKDNGGYLSACEEYYTNPRAMRDTQRLLDYITARWGANNNLLAWKLFTEVDLTGPTIEFYHNPVVAKWHSAVGSYLKGIDIYKHLVTTHWMLSYKRINRPLATIGELDFISTDAYYNQGGGTGELVSLLKGSREFGKSCDKPLVITEFGGSSYGDHMTNLMKQVPIGIWTGFFNEMGVIPMYWWFALVEDKDLYGDYRALSEFGRNEDRRGMDVQEMDIHGGRLKMNVLKSKDRVLAWLFDKNYYFSDSEALRPSTIKSLQIVVPAPFDGPAALEIWDSKSGEVVSKGTVECRSGRAQVTLPDFDRHIAIKIMQNKTP